MPSTQEVGSKHGNRHPTQRGHLCPLSVLQHATYGGSRYAPTGWLQREACGNLEIQTVQCRGLAEFGLAPGDLCGCICLIDWGVMGYEDHEQAKVKESRAGAAYGLSGEQESEEDIALAQVRQDGDEAELEDDLPPFLSRYTHDSRRYVAYTVKLPAEQLAALQSIWLELKKLYGAHSPDKSGMIQQAVSIWLRRWEGAERNDMLRELLKIREQTRRRQHRKDID